MLVLAMEFSRCARGAAQKDKGPAQGRPRGGGHPKGPSRATLRPTGRSV